MQRQWTSTFRELGIVPLFPPREDVVVGDVYAYGYDPNSLELDTLLEKRFSSLTDDKKEERLSIGMSSRLTRINFNDEALEEYQRTPSFPQTSADYNTILGNPAVAAADEKIDALTAKIKGFQDTIAAAKDDVKKATDRVIDLTRKNDDALKAYTNAQTKLAEGKALTVDTSVEKARLATAKNEQRTAADEVTAALREQEDVANEGQSQKDAAAAKLRTAKRKQEDMALAVARAKDELDSRSSEKVDVTGLDASLAAAKSAKDSAEISLLAGTREKDDKVNALAQQTATQNPFIAASQAELDQAIAIKKAVAEAGVKMLYPQPKDASVDVFTTSVLIKDELLKNSRVNRLRLVAFPEFATVSFTKGDLSALVPIGAMNLGLNISESSVKKVSVKIPSAESYSVSLDTVLGKLFTDPSGKTLQPKIVDGFKWGAVSASGSNSGSGSFYVRVITEVYYARAMDISIFSSSSFGGRAGYQSPLAQPQNATESVNVTAESSSAIRLADIQRRISEAQVLPGGSIQVVSQNESSIGMRRVFDRPVAIGFRALVLRLNRETLQVEKIVSVDHGSVSSASPPAVY